MTDAVTDAVQPRREGEDHPLDRLAATTGEVDVTIGDIVFPQQPHASED
ncbi:MAG: hypothetical protein LC679_14180 [Intrasporangiaceae bacterium]|nr:hypothetical protein [Intrasporangiaceae bacterium]